MSNEQSWFLADAVEREVQDNDNSHWWLLAIMGVLALGMSVAISVMLSTDFNLL